MNNKNMKKILLLGGSAQQVVAIEKAKELGYYTIVCDFLTDNPGQFVADKFYLVSTTDKDAILKVAQDEKIDGILAYASDPAAPTAAYVAEKLGLPGNPYESVEILCNKDKFRKFLKENGFYTPLAYGFKSKDEVYNKINEYTLPIIVKPVDSSGSKGVTVLKDLKNLDEKIEFAFSFSRSHKIIIEEYIEKKHKYLVGGDIFIIEGKIEIWGLMNCYRDYDVNPLVPVGKSYPLQLEKFDVDNIKNVLQNLVTALDIKNGAMNVEVIVDSNNRVYLIDIGPRSGGNMIPDLLNMVFNIDVVEMCINVAMNEKIELKKNEPNLYYATHNLHSNVNGRYKDIIFSKKIEKYIVKKCIYKNENDEVMYFDNASKALGIIFLKFSNKDEMNDILNNINLHIRIILR